MNLHWDIILVVHKACDIETRRTLEKAFNVPLIRTVKVPKKIVKHLINKVKKHFIDAIAAFSGTALPRGKGRVPTIFMNTVQFHHGDFWQKEPDGHWIPKEYENEGPHMLRPSMTHTFMSIPLQQDRKAIQFDAATVLFFDLTDLRHPPTSRYALVPPSPSDPDSSIWRYETMRTDPHSILSQPPAPFLHFYSIQNNFGMIASGRIVNDPESLPILYRDWICPNENYGYRPALDLREPQNHLAIAFFQERMEPPAENDDDDEEEDQNDEDEEEEEDQNDEDDEEEDQNDEDDEDDEEVPIGGNRASDIVYIFELHPGV